METAKFTIFVGPTNSGKTYNALETLKQSNNGIYMAPLRLLANEVYVELNSAGTACSLLTGEEKEEVENAQCLSCTIETLDLDTHYDTAVIDEAQMLGDKERGSAWTRAILNVDADHVVVCCAPEALDIICHLIDLREDAYVVKQCERKADIVCDGEIGFWEIQPGDAIICFSAKNVKRIANDVRREKNYKCSVIYGAMPHEIREVEAKRFADKETQVLVSTDAVGMGMNLPIRRIVFAQTDKFDGTKIRDLTPSEVKQIAGRAGRYGIYDVGHYASFERAYWLKQQFEKPVEPIKKAYIGVPDGAYAENEYISDTIARFRAEESDPVFHAADLQERYDKAIALEYEMYAAANDMNAFFTAQTVRKYMMRHDQPLREIWAACRDKVDGFVDTRSEEHRLISLFLDINFDLKDEKSAALWLELFKNEFYMEPNARSIRAMCYDGFLDHEDCLELLDTEQLESGVRACDIVSSYEKKLGTESDYQEAREYRNKFIEELAEQKNDQDRRPIEIHESKRNEKIYEKFQGLVDQAAKILHEQRYPRHDIKELFDGVTFPVNNNKMSVKKWGKDGHGEIAAFMGRDPDTKRLVTIHFPKHQLKRIKTAAWKQEVSNIISEAGYTEEDFTKKKLSTIKWSLRDDDTIYSHKDELVQAIDPSASIRALYKAMHVDTL